MKQFNEDVLDMIKNINDDIIQRNKDILTNTYLPFTAFVDINERISYLVHEYSKEVVFDNFVNKENINLNGLAKKVQDTFRDKVLYVNDAQIKVILYSGMEDIVFSEVLSQLFNVKLSCIGEILFMEGQYVRQIFISNQGIIYYIDNPCDKIGIFAYNLQDFFIKIFEIPIDWHTRVTIESAEVFHKYYELIDQFENQGN